MGYYLKLSRAISQTPWMVDSEGYNSQLSPSPVDDDEVNGSLTDAASLSAVSPGQSRMTATSVAEEIVRPLLSLFGSVSYNFHSSGREDLDVRMLGNGRTFVLEFIEAKRIIRESSHYTELQQIINQQTCMIQVKELRLATKSIITHTKDSLYALVEVGRDLHLTVCVT